MKHEPARPGLGTATTIGIVLALAAAALGAQYQPGDIVIGPGFAQSKSHVLLGVTPAGAKFTFTRPLFSTTGMMPAPNNRSLWVTGAGPNHPAGVYDLAPSGALTTIAVRPFQLMGPDGEGGAIGSDNTTILRLSRGGKIATIRTIVGGWGAHGIDDRTGDLILLQSQAALRLGLDAAAALTTIAVAPANESWPAYSGAMSYDPEWDAMMVGELSGRSSGQLFMLAVRNRLTTVGVGGSLGIYCSPKGVHIHPVQRSAVLCYRTKSPPWYYYEHVELVDVRNQAVYRRVWATGLTGYRFDHTAIAGSRHLGALSPAPRGGTFAAMVSFPGEGSARYAVGYSFSMQPGIQSADGRKIYLGSDPLVRLSLTDPVTFPGGTGVLDANGEAVARMRVPSIPGLAGLRVFAVAVSIAGGMIRTISAPIGVTIQ